MTLAAPSKSLLVLKYGGSSLAEPAQIRSVATDIAKLHSAGHSLIVVVSAMGKTTDQLVELAEKVSPAPNRRELDMLLTTGERISMALLSMALHSLGVPAISLTGSQAGLLTDDLHSNARITEIKPIRVEAELARKKVVVLAGFQGVSPVTKEVTTLGRGGSDTTAIAMAAHFKATLCEIRKDVDGVYSADPRVVENARHLPELSFSQLAEMTFWGAKVLHYRSVELAKTLNVPITIALAHASDAKSKFPQQTLIRGESKMFEQDRILSVNSIASVVRVAWPKKAAENFSQGLDRVFSIVNAAGLPIPQLLDTESSGDQTRVFITAPKETLGAIVQLLKKELYVVDESFATVTATCQGSYSSPLTQKLAHSLEKNNVRVEKIVFSALSLTFFVPAAQREMAVKHIHEFVG